MGQPGSGIRTWSPPSTTARTALTRAPTAPTVTTTLLSDAIAPVSRVTLAAIACLVEARPPLKVYLVAPLLAASKAASVMCAGVANWGSPTSRRATSPSAAALAIILRMPDAGRAGDQA